MGAETVEALGKRADFRGPVDTRQHTVTRLLDLTKQSIDVPVAKLTLPVHDLPGDEHVPHVARIHHRDNRARYVIHRPGADGSRLEHDDVCLLARSQGTDLVEDAIEAAPAMVAISITCRDVTSCGTGSPPGLLSGNASRWPTRAAGRRLRASARRIGRHVRVDVRTQAGQDAVIERLLKGRHDRAASASR